MRKTLQINCGSTECFRCITPFSFDRNLRAIFSRNESKRPRTSRFFSPYETVRATNYNFIKIPPFAWHLCKTEAFPSRRPRCFHVTFCETSSPPPGDQQADGAGERSGTGPRPFDFRQPPTVLAANLGATAAGLLLRAHNAGHEQGKEETGTKVSLRAGRSV